MPRIHYFLSLLVVLTFCGCGTYRLGSNLPEARRAIAVPTFENVTDLPEAGSYTTRALLNEMVRDGAFKPTKLDKANIRLLGTVKHGSWRSVRYDRNRSLETTEYKLKLSLELTVVDVATGKILIDRKVITGETTFNTRYDLQTTRQDALPRAATDLAKNVHEFLIHALGQ